MPLCIISFLGYYFPHILFLRIVLLSTKTNNICESKRIALKGQYKCVPLYKTIYDKLWIKVVLVARNDMSPQEQPPGKNNVLCSNLGVLRMNHSTLKCTPMKVYFGNTRSLLQQLRDNDSDSDQCGAQPGLTLSTCFRIPCKLRAFATAVF